MFSAHCWFKACSAFICYFEWNLSFCSIYSLIYSPILNLTFWIYATCWETNPSSSCKRGMFCFLPLFSLSWTHTVASQLTCTLSVENCREHAECIQAHKALWCLEVMLEVWLPNLEKTLWWHHGVPALGAQSSWYRILGRALENMYAGDYLRGNNLC